MYVQYTYIYVPSFRGRSYLKVYLEVYRLVSHAFKALNHPACVRMLCACVCGSSIMCTGLSAEVVRPFYKERADVAMRILQDELKDAMGPEHPVLVHKPEGCIFLWMWFRDLPISAEELYFRYVLAPACLALPCLVLSCLAPAAVRPTYLLSSSSNDDGWVAGWLVGGV